MSTPKQFASIKDLAKFFGVTPKTIRKWRGTGYLPSPAIPSPRRPLWLLDDMLLKLGAAQQIVEPEQRRKARPAVKAAGPRPLRAAAQ